MIATPQLRFVERYMRDFPDISDSLGFRPNMRMVKILQQYWCQIGSDMDHTAVFGEWRDVPLVPVDVAE